MNHALEPFLVQKPGIWQLFNQMNREGVRWAIFAGSEVGLLTGNRQPTDLDMIVHNDDFEILSRLLPRARRTEAEHFAITASDGEQLTNVAHTLATTLDNTALDVMAHCHFVTAEGSFPVHLTDLATAARLHFDVKGTTLYFAASFDTILIKAFMRRDDRQHKFDYADAAALASHYPPEVTYVHARLAETGLTNGGRRFLEQFGCALNNWFIVK